LISDDGQDYHNNHQDKQDVDRGEAADDHCQVESQHSDRYLVSAVLADLHVIHNRRKRPTPIKCMEKHLNLGVKGFEVKRVATFVLMLAV